MSHKTFKVCILIENLIENFYIKHYIDEYQPVFNRFKNQVFQRNPNVNTTNLKIYWIDGENDEILIACEEDFRLFLEEGKGRKIFFSVNNNEAFGGEGPAQPMEAEETQQNTRCDRRSRKGRDEERELRQARKLAEKLKYLEEKTLKKEDKGRRFLEKREHKHAEKLEKAKRRVEQIRTLMGSIDPANLNSSNYCSQESRQESDFNVNVGASTSNENASDVHPSPETIRLLSNAIAGCLQPCSLINKILNEVIAMIPQMVEPMAPPPPYAENENQNATDVPMEQRTQATNTSTLETPVVGVQQASNEIEALFKEAARELEKMNEIVNNPKAMETSTSSGNTAITQIERVFKNITDSAISNATVINMEEHEPLLKSQTDETDNVVDNSMIEEDFKVVTPPKSMMRSRESSIEVHDVGSMMSDDSRDWTILSADQDDISVEPQRVADPTLGAIPKKTSVDNFAQVDFTAQKATTETQTPSMLSESASKEELQASVQKSIEIVQKSIETIQKSMESASATFSKESSIQNTTPVTSQQASIIVDEPKVEQSAGAPLYGIIYSQPIPTAPIQSRANAMASGIIQDANIISAKKPETFPPAVVVYDPNPRINTAVHTMMNMGFTNEDNWLTQLMVNVDGDIPKALNFLTPQPKKN